MKNQNFTTKRALRTALLVLLLIVVGMGKTYAQTIFTVGNLNYSVNEDGVSVTVIGHVDGTGASGELDIPEYVIYNGENYIVNAIGDYAFAFCSGISSYLTLPNSIISIGDYAFDQCNLYGNLVIPNSVTTIGSGAFIYSGFYGSTLVLGNNINIIGQTAFYGCHFMGMLTIPNSVTSLGVDAFTYCDFEQIIVESENPIYDSRNNCNAVIETETNVLVMGCKNTIIPNSVTVIGEKAFRAGAITSIVIPNSVKEIRIGAFTQCYKLTSISIPSSVEYIETRSDGFMGGTFSDCYNLEQITVESDNPVYDSRNNCNAIIESSTNTLIVGCKNTLIPNTVNTIGFASFDGCTELSTILIPKSVTYIDDRAYSWCTNVDSVITKGENPANLGNNSVFFNVPCTTLIVPCGCVSAYENSEWQWYFPNIIEDCTSLSENSNNDIAAFPSPTNSLVTIDAEKLKHITISNLLGQTIFESIVSGNTFEYDFSNHKAGIYLIRIETESGVVTKKVSVER